MVCFATLLASAALTVPVDASAHRALPHFVCGTQSGGSPPDARHARPRHPRP
jgi:hypothetical protein